MNTSLTNPVIPVAHSYTVEIRFTGNGLDPTEITRRLNLRPHNTLAASDVISLDRKRRPFWAYKGHNEAGFQPQWGSLEAGLIFLLAHLIPRRSEVIDISKSFEGIWWCGHFQTSFDGGPTLSSDILTKLASFGLPLAIDNYFSDQS